MKNTFLFYINYIRVATGKIIKNKYSTQKNVILNFFFIIVIATITYLFWYKNIFNIKIILLFFKHLFFIFFFFLYLYFRGLLPRYKIFDIITLYWKYIIIYVFFIFITSVILF